jgi:hypothetical protein
LQRADLVEKGKPVRHAPVFDKLTVGEPADVEDINGNCPIQQSASIRRCVLQIAS